MSCSIFDANSFFLATGCRRRIVQSGRQQSVDWREERAARAGKMDTKYLWSTQVRFLLPELFLKVIFVLYRKGEILQRE